MTRRIKGHRQALPFLNLRNGRGRRSRDGAIPHRGGGDTESLNQRQTAGEQGRQAARELAGGVGAHERAEEGDVEDPAVEPLSIGGFLQPDGGAKGPRHEHHQQRQAPLARLVGKAQKDAGGQRQLSAEASVEAGELRQDSRQHHVHEPEHAREKHHRIDGGGDDLFLDGLVELYVRDEPPQDRLQIAAPLAGDQAGRKHLRIKRALLAKRLGESRTRLDAITHRAERTLEPGIPLALDHEVHRLGEGQTRFKKCRELLAKKLQAFRLDPGRPEPEPVGRFSVRKKEETLAQKICLEGLFVRGVETPLDDLSRRRADLADVLHKLLERLSVAAVT